MLSAAVNLGLPCVLVVGFGLSCLRISDGAYLHLSRLLLVGLGIEAHWVTVGVADVLCCLLVASFADELQFLLRGLACVGHRNASGLSSILGLWGKVDWMALAAS